jgi:hypothetical protein
MLQDIIAARLDALKTSYARGPTGDDLTHRGRANTNPPLLGEEQDGKDEDTEAENGGKPPTVGGAAINPPLLLGGEQDGDSEDQEAPPPVKIDWSPLKTVAEFKEELHCCNLSVGGTKADLIERICQDHSSKEKTQKVMGVSGQQKQSQNSRKNAIVGICFSVETEEPLLQGF